MSSKKLASLLSLAAVLAVLQGCSPAENPKSGVPVMPGDYMGAPGTTHGQPGAGPVAKPANPNK
ncbi:MAG TPA: hypothetical protein VGL56_08750 [Fimbriimonadaceae bacterium]